MGRVVVTEFISLDGVIDSPGGGPFEHAGWTFKFDRGEDGDRFKLEELMAADAQLLGRTTYEGFAAAWPTMADTGEFGVRMNTMPKYVVSSTMAPGDATWQNSSIIDGSDLAGDVGRLKEQLAGDILVAGSATLVRSLAGEDLIDEYRLMMFPVVLGSGLRLFGQGTPHMTLALTATTALGPDGVTVLTYARDTKVER